MDWHSSIGESSRKKDGTGKEPKVPRIGGRKDSAQWQLALQGWLEKKEGKHSSGWVGGVRASPGDTDL